jgi:hypothetical protein
MNVPEIPSCCTEHLCTTENSVFFLNRDGHMTSYLYVRLADWFRNVLLTVLIDRTETRRSMYQTFYIEPEIQK